MSLKTVLFISHKKARCGIYEFGQNIYATLSKSRLYNFIKLDCSTLKDVTGAIAEYSPAALIYNYHPSVLPWIATKIAPRLFRNNITSINVPQIGIIHEITQATADYATVYKNRFLLGRSSRLSNSLFDSYIAPDPTLLLRNPYVFKTGRLIPAYENNFPPPLIPTIGSFGFGTPNKGFDQIVTLVQHEFDAAIIKLNIAFADFGDEDGANARLIAAQCKKLITKQGIQLQVSHKFYDSDEVLEFLAQNTINVFLYHDTGNRGLSSTVDNALAVRRPVAISDSIMFRHLFDTEPSVRITQNTLRKIIDNGFGPLDSHRNEWNGENLLWEYERIVTAVLGRSTQPIEENRRKFQALQFRLRKTLSLPDKTFTWLRNTNQANEDDMRIVRSSYEPVTIPTTESLNRILDNRARKTYQAAIDKLMELAPKTMAKKIPAANVQQAFVFDTVYRNLKNYNRPRILCVGSYEDTACIALKKLGYDITEIDPVLNYDLQQYFTRPSTKKASYDIILSTSVIEHVPDDEAFVKCISELLVPSGIAVLTCDYNDQWKPGELKPDVDVRLYTQSDLKQRLLPLMGECYLIDEPQWDCLQPDFSYLGKYQYTFASIVVRKS
jgi:hypothetical protein